MSASATSSVSDLSPKHWANFHCDISAGLRDLGFGRTFSFVGWPIFNLFSCLAEPVIDVLDVETLHEDEEVDESSIESEDDKDGWEYICKSAEEDEELFITKFLSSFTLFSLLLVITISNNRTMAGFEGGLIF